MRQQPLLTTERLVLRPLELSDAPKIQQLAGDTNIANGTINVPHPYDDGVAGQWIGKNIAGWQSQKSAIFAITLKSNNQLVGCIGLQNIEGETAQLGFWIGVPYWGKGYCTEAAARIAEFGFRRLNLQLLYARHLSRDSAPGKVMQKIGMRHITTKNDAARVNMITENVEYYELGVLVEA